MKLFWQAFWKASKKKIWKSFDDTWRKLYQESFLNVFKDSEQKLSEEQAFENTRHSLNPRQNFTQTNFLNF